MEYFAGLDLSLRSCALCIADHKGQVLFERELPCEVVDITECLVGFPHPIERVRFEAGTMSQHLWRIAALYRIEADLRGQDSEARLAARQERSSPRIAEFENSLTEHSARVSAKSPLGEALKYIAKYWDGLCLYLADGRIEMDSNAVERTIGPIALNRKNALFAGHDAGAENWGVIASLIETCKLNSVDPNAYLTATLSAIVSGTQTKPDRRSLAVEPRLARVIGAPLTEQ